MNSGLGQEDTVMAVRAIVSSGGSVESLGFVLSVMANHWSVLSGWFTNTSAHE